MLKNYQDITDVVSLLVYCPAERSYLLTKESYGEYWIPSSRSVKNCWKMTAHQIYFELFGTDTLSQCQPIRLYKIWLPNHPKGCVYHSVYKVCVKSDVKKRTKLRTGMRNHLQWFSVADLERQRAHATLRSPELVVFAQMSVGDAAKEDFGMETGMLVEICEDNVLIGVEAAGGATALASPHYQLLQAAGYTRDDQIRLYREFLSMVYPAVYMSSTAFTQFMMEHGWDRVQCPNLFRAADISGRNGLSFVELLLWVAALEPHTKHAGVPAELRCRYIFRYFDSNRDMKLEFVELKELMAAVRTARQLSVDALSVAREADLVLRQLGLSPNSPLSLADFQRSVDEQRVRGTGDLLRAPSSLVDYLRDLHARELLSTSTVALKPVSIQGEMKGSKSTDTLRRARSGAGGGAPGEYALATGVVRLRARSPPEMMHLSTFDEDAVSISTARLISDSSSLERLGGAVVPCEAFFAIHYFATPIDKPVQRRTSGGGSVSVVKDAYAWMAPSEEAAFGASLLRLAEAVRPICMNEPRLLKLTSPVYAIGDLHGNLAALLAMEAALWPSGPALVPAHLLFLGDYVDRGPHGTELMAYLFAAKLQRPNSVHLIRGNHETRDIQKMFTFHTECITKYGETEGAHIWNAINEVFDVLALAAVVDDKVFCCHGGIPPPWVCPLVSVIDKIPAPLPRPSDQSSVAWELLWNDPVKANKITATMALELAANEGFAKNGRRGAGHVFDSRALERFLSANKLAMVLRAHELHQHGFMVFCCHGGIPPPWVCPLVSVIDKIPAPLPRPSDQSSVAWELLWNDPVKANKITATMALELAANEGFAKNGRRGAGHVFDSRALERFLSANKLAMVLRAHELHQHGFMCQHGGRLVSVFSSSRYCGGGNESCVALLRRGKMRLIRVAD